MDVQEQLDKLFKMQKAAEEWGEQLLKEAADSGVYIGENDDDEK